MAFTAGLTSGLTEPITKTLLEDYFYGGLTLEELVALLGSTLWLDATETYAKSKVAVDLVNTRGIAAVDYLESIEGIVEMGQLGVEMVFEQAEETQISELGLEIVFEEV